QMKLSFIRKAAALVPVAGAIAIFLVFCVTQLAQTNIELPSRVGHINDFARVLDDATRQQLESTLENFKQKTGIQFDVATVESTSGVDISDFSQQLAQSWKLIGRASRGRNVLLLISVNEKSSFTQFSTGVQSKLPEGIFGEIGQRLRPYLSSGQTAEGLTSTAQYFVSAVAQQQGVDLNASSESTSKVAASNDAATNPSPAVAATPQPIAVSTPISTKPTARVESSRDDSEAANEAEEVELTLTKPAEARLAALKSFLNTHPNSTARRRAFELLVVTHATLGDELLGKGESLAGIEQLLLAISEAPIDASDKLFNGVVAQIPLNLFLRRESAAADTAARNIAAKFAGDPKKLLAVASFYATVERGEAAREIAAQALKLAPDLAEAHQSMAMALHISLRLSEAADEYKRALELDPNLKGARRSLADLRRALGKDEEALELYRQQLATDAADKAARAGLIISLLNLGRQDEAKTELESALKADSNNLVLLASAAYWFAAHDQTDLAVELGSKAVELQPRYTWSQIAVARALIAQGNPLAAERAIRLARVYAKFPTLDYELANALAAAGLYEEAAEALSQKFRIKNNRIETLLGGHISAEAASFVELLAPERQASIFQSVAPETEANAKMLKDLLVFTTAVSPPEGTSIDESAAVAAAKEFAAGTDAARAHRELYAASRLLQKGVGFQTAYDLAEAARTSADAALTVPALTVAVQADEYRETRARAIAAGGTPDIPEAPRNLLSNILRGRIEDISGWALFNLDKTDDAIDHLRRAVNILPEGTPLRRGSLWHLAAALERQGKNEEALSTYIVSYNAGEPDPARRAIIERLYRRVNGSTDGLEERIGRQAATGNAEASRARVVNEPAPAPTVEVAATSAPSPEVATASPSPSPEVPVTQTPAPSPSEPPIKQEAQPSPAPTPEATPSPSETPAAPAAETKPPEMSVTPPATLTVGGLVRDANDAPLANVVVVLISSQGTVLTTNTDERGAYVFTVAPSEAGYRIIPSRTGFTFDPVDKLLTSIAADVKDVNFVATARKQ
ncbi:MAG TPA: TPM domain-containing protein, partial [Pyrinomonadaceae bacterium]